MEKMVDKSKIKAVGVLGVGRMGKNMVDLLLANGFEVHAFDPFPPALEYAKNAGAVTHSSPAELAKSVKLIIMSLPKPQHVFSVIKDENGMLDVLTPEHILVDTSTVSPQTTRDAAALVAPKGTKYVDSPVLGRPSAAGKWFLPSGGDAEAIELATPALLCFAKNVKRVGDNGAGNALKLLNQLMFSAINAISTEVMALTEKVGIDKKTFFEVVSASGAATVSGLFCEVAKTIVEDTFDQPAFTVELLCKDAGLGIQMAKDAGINPLVAGFVQMLNENARDQGLANLDTSAMTKLFDKMYSDSFK